MKLMKVVSLRLFLFLSLSYFEIPYCCVAKMGGYVVGGNFVNISKVPYAAHLKIKCKTRNRSDTFSCGSTILNQRILITAAHCFENCFPSSGIDVITGTESSKDELTHAAENFIIHPHYDMDTVENDIALIKLAKPLKLGPKVKRVMIIKDKPAAETAFLAGWGLVSENPANRSIYIKGTDQAILTHDECETLIHDALPPNGTFCASGIMGTKDFGYAAKGDSGSGLVVNDTILIGLVSFKLMETTYVTIYTDVAYHLPWIIKTSKSLYCGK